MNRSAASPRKLQFEEHCFFFASSLMCLVVALIGFGPGFIHHLFTDLSAVAVIVHFHGLVMMGWLLFFINQTRLIARRSVRLHKRLGYLSVFIFALVIISSIVLSLNNLVKSVPPHIDTLLGNLFSLQVVAIVLGPVLYIIGVSAAQSDLSAHKRYMLILTILFLEAAFARMQYLPGLNFLENGVLMGHVYHGLLFVPLLVFDVKHYKKLHPATIKGLILISGGNGFTIWCWNNPAWLDLTNTIEEIIKPF